MKVAIEAENKEESLKLANLIAHQNDSLRSVHHLIPWCFFLLLLIRQKLIRANHDVSHLRVQLDRLLRERKQHEFYLQLAARDVRSSSPHQLAAFPQFLLSPLLPHAFIHSRFRDNKWSMN